MKTEKSREMIFGVVVLGIAAFYTVMTLMIQNKGGVVNGRTVPLILSGLLWVLGIVQIKRAIKESNEVIQGDEIDKKTVLKTAILILLYISFFEMIGFLLMTILYLFLQFFVLTPSDKKANPIVYGVIATAVSLFVYSTFRYGLDIMLPQGIITFF